MTVLVGAMGAILGLVAVIAALGIVAATLLGAFGGLAEDVGRDVPPASSGASIMPFPLATVRPTLAASAPDPKAPPGTSTATGESLVDLGQRPATYGPSEQARDLLAAIAAAPGRARYTVTYHTDEGTVVFECDVAQDLLVRVHRRSDGHGTAEVWMGYVLDRLQNAAVGASLNDTPAGEMVGTFEMF